jgi:thiamine transport system substrate-binding protein
MTRTARTVALLAVLALGASACGDDDASTDDAITSPETTLTADTTDTTDNAADTATDTTADTADTAGTTDTAADTGDETATAAEVTETITLVAYDSFPAPDPENPVHQALADFTDETGIEVELLISGDTGTMLSKAELTAGNPEGDVMWGVDNTFLSRAVGAGVFEPYLSPAVAELPSEFTDLVPEGEATPVDFGDVCVNYDIAALDELGIDPPTSFAELADHADLLVVENPATSSPGLAFLMATIAEFGDGWTDYWTDLRDGGVEIVDSWTAAYYESFSWAGGDRPLVVSYGSSPPFEVLFAEEPMETAPTGVVESTCFRQVEFAGVLAGTEHPDAARRLLDFLISERFQREVPLNLFVWPVNPDVELDPVFTEFATIPADPLRLDPSEIDAHRSDWIDEWTVLMT